MNRSQVGTVVHFTTFGLIAGQCTAYCRAAFVIEAEQDDGDLIGLYVVGPGSNTTFAHTVPLDVTSNDDSPSRPPSWHPIPEG